MYSVTNVKKLIEYGCVIMQLGNGQRFSLLLEEVKKSLSVTTENC